jgi:hypothetical protein
MTFFIIWLVSGWILSNLWMFLTDREYFDNDVFAVSFTMSFLFSFLGLFWIFPLIVAGANKLKNK